jgi:pilus assembly protein CpaB
MAAMLARQFLQGAVIVQAPATNERTMVVAGQFLAFGATLTGDNLREIPWPGEDAVEGAFQSKADLLKDGRRVALVAMQKNEPILAAKITGPNQKATLSTLIDEGMRAVSVRVDDTRGVAGFVLPGDRVDVVLTRSDPGTPAASMADVLLQNVKVLAIDQVAGERQDKPTVARTVTLELTVQQSQKVILAEGVGRLSLILRQAGEANAAETRRVTLSDLGVGEAVDNKEEAARFAKLEAQLEALRKAAAESEAAAKDEALKRVAELEARLQAEIEKGRRPGAPAPVVALPKRDDRVVINVIRGISKRDEYTVLSERP